MKLPEILAFLRRLAPESSALDDDPVGLLIAPAKTEIDSITVCLDAYRPIIDSAIASGDDLIVAHHPLIYHPLRRLDGETPASDCAVALVRAGVGLYAMHTNWDRAPGGINDTLAALVGLHDVTDLSETGTGAIARVGFLPAPLTVAEMADLILSRLDCSRTSALRLFPDNRVAPILRVAVCGGAGGGLVGDAVRAGADALVTADVRHHEYLEAYGGGITIFDAGHCATEEPGMQNLARLLADRFPNLKVRFAAL